MNLFKVLGTAIKDRGMIEEIKDLEAAMEQLKSEGKLSDALTQAKQTYDQAEDDVKNKKMEGNSKEYQEIFRQFMIALKGFHGFDAENQTKAEHVVAEYNEMAEVSGRETI